MKRSAFTLIELLTVMAVLGILMGLLFPAFSGIRKRAYRTQTHNLVSHIPALAFTNPDFPHVPILVRHYFFSHF